MRGFLVRLAVNVVALFVVAGLSNGKIVVHGVGAAFLAALLIGVANAIVKPILMFIGGSVTFVLSCLTLGLWSLVLSWLINGLIFFVAGQDLIAGFAVKSFWAALWASLALSVINALASALTKSEPIRH